MNTEQKIYIIGHKNPDTDTICSSIALAYLKNQISDVKHVAKRAGQINEETEFVLKYFKKRSPGYLPDVGTQVKDMKIWHRSSISRDTTLKKAWAKIQEEHAYTLPITDENDYLEGLITVGDITRTIVNQGNRALSEAKTPFRDIAETIDGEILAGDKERIFDDGRIVIGAANPDMIKQYMLPNDLMVLGNRSDNQLCAVEMNASCIVIGLDAEISPVILKYADESGCVVIRSPHDTFSIARLIIQSIPVRAFMNSDALIKFHMKDSIEKTEKTMVQHKFRDFPVLDQDEKCVGTVSRRNLLNIVKKQVILVDHNEVSQAVDNIHDAEIMEIIDHHRIADLETVQPVMFRNQPVGCTATIITQMYDENGVEIPEDIAGLLCAAIISDTLMFRSPTCTAMDKAYADRLAKIAGIKIEEFAKAMFKAGSNLKSKSDEEIFYQDYKKFLAGDISFGVGQISSMDADELEIIEARMKQAVEAQCGRHGTVMIFFMLTNILEESTRLICCGEDSVETAEAAFNVKATDGICVLPGIVSRKKQLIPAIMQALQEI